MSTLDPKTIQPESADSAPVLSAAQETPNWQMELRDSVRSLSDLLTRLELRTDQVDGLADSSFPLFAPESFVSRMKAGDPSDPLLLQVLPVSREAETVAGFLTDPVGDLAAREAPGLLHKYEGRALLVLTGACAIHCRYCFRRHFPYSQEKAWSRQWNETLEYLSRDSSIEEVLLSGGDPLTLVDEVIEQVIDDLEALPNLKRIRIHTRLPIVIPSRVTRELLDRLSRGRTTKVVVVHSNHAREIDASVQQALQSLASRVLVFNQSVLLRGVNDSLSALVDLSKRLIESRVTPYNLNVLDAVQGGAHFDVPTERGLQLIEQMRQCLPGYAVPRLVREVRGAGGKTVLA